MERYVQRIRYPPFEFGHMSPEHVPISMAIVECENMDVTSFTIGRDDGWFVEWREVEKDDSAIAEIDCEISDSPPKFLTSTRVGWFVRPDKLHNLSRRLILPTVSLLIVSLFIHAIEPGLVEQGIIGETIAGSISIGPLEYPRLLFYTFPLFIMPLFVRTIANFRDFNRQRAISTTPYKEPTISVKTGRSSSTVSVREIDDNLNLSRARIQVGVAMPERSSVLASLRRKEEGQPSPGMSTKLPEKRIASGDDTGTGVGESTPMQLTSKKSVILEPLRMMERGDWCNIKLNSDIILDNPSDNWPGTVYSSLIAIHWEIVMEFIESDGRKIMWVFPIVMPQSEEPTNIESPPIISGRAELSDF